MRICVCAMGRLRSGPEKDLCDNYQMRFNKIGKGLNLGPLEIKELDDRKAQTPHTQAPLIERSIPNGAFICALDERGEVLNSPKFSGRLENLRDQGHKDVAFLIGGASGLSPDITRQAHMTLSFGAMVWPHMLARIMLTEQIYRAATILSGSPYHKL